MKKSEELLEQAVLQWGSKEYHGCGTAIIPPSVDARAMILSLLERMYVRSPTMTTRIIVNNFDDRQSIIDYLTTQENNENNNEFRNLIKSKNIIIVTADWFEKTNVMFRDYLIITYNVNDLGSKSLFRIKTAKFKLIITNGIFANEDLKYNIEKVAPIISSLANGALDSLRTSTPVEEIRIPVSIPEDSEDKKLLDFYCEKIRISLTIFESFDNIAAARIGKGNLTANDVCIDIAQRNGWNTNLDMSVEYNRQLDNMYNPNNLRELASKTYDMIRERSSLLSDYKAKLDVILDILSNPEYSDYTDKVLIISKRGEFATTITNYLNNKFGKEVCANYHNKMESVEATDIDGNPIFVKSGVNKGHRKIYAAQAQRTFNNTKYNANKINILSCANSIDEALTGEVKMIIITSPMCKDIESYLYKLSQLKFPLNKVMMISLYVTNTIEEERFSSKMLNSTHTIIKDSNNENNSSDFVVV